MRKSITRFWPLFIALLVIWVLLAYQPAYAQAQVTNTDFWSGLDASVKVIAGVVAAVTAILGVPMHFCKFVKQLWKSAKLNWKLKALV